MSARPWKRRNRHPMRPDHTAVHRAGSTAAWDIIGGGQARQMPVRIFVGGKSGGAKNDFRLSPPLGTTANWPLGFDPRRGEISAMEACSGREAKASIQIAAKFVNNIACYSDVQNVARQMPAQEIAHIFAGNAVKALRITASTTRRIAAPKTWENKA